MKEFGWGVALRLVAIPVSSVHSLYAKIPGGSAVAQW